MFRLNNNDCNWTALIIKFTSIIMRMKQIKRILIGSLSLLTVVGVGYSTFMIVNSKKQEVQQQLNVSVGDVKECNSLTFIKSNIDKTSISKYGFYDKDEQCYSPKFKLDIFEKLDLGSLPENENQILFKSNMGSCVKDINLAAYIKKFEYKFCRDDKCREMLYTGSVSSEDNIDIKDSDNPFTREYVLNMKQVRENEENKDINDVYIKYAYEFDFSSLITEDNNFENSVYNKVKGIDSEVLKFNIGWQIKK